jgi:hypothetical protein
MEAFSKSYHPLFFIDQFFQLEEEACHTVMGGCNISRCFFVGGNVLLLFDHG